MSEIKPERIKTFDTKRDPAVSNVVRIVRDGNVRVAAIYEPDGTIKLVAIATK